MFHVVASCRANPAMVAPSTRNCRIAQQITRVPRRARGAHTEWFCSMKVTIRQVRARRIQRCLCHRIRTGTPTQGRIDHLHHHTPVTLSAQPTTRAASTAITGLSVEHKRTLTPSDNNQMEILNVNEQITPTITTKPHSPAAGRVRHHPRSLTTAGVEAHSSSRSSTSTHNSRPTPNHPHSTRKSPFSAKGRVQFASIFLAVRPFSFRERFIPCLGNRCRQRSLHGWSVSSLPSIAG